MFAVRRPPTRWARHRGPLLPGVGSGAWFVAGLFGLLFVWLLAGCQAQPVPPPGLAAEAALTQRIAAEIGNAACSRDADCRTLALGSKPCGGPARWVAWSATASQAGTLAPMAQELAALQQQRQAAEGIMSTCSVVPDPGARCEAGHCQLNRPAIPR